MKKKHPEHVNLERWLVSYADFITLLFAFFVVMYAISQADLAKFTFINGLFVHPLSPKTWSMILLAHSQISDSGFDYPVRVLIIWATFTCGAIIFHSSWGVL